MIEVKCPVSKRIAVFGNGCEFMAEPCRRLAKRFRMTIRGVFAMVRATALYGPEACEDGEEIYEDTRQLFRDKARLASRHASVEELLAIRERARRFLKRVATFERNPAKRAKLEALLVPSPTWQRIQQLAAAQLRRRKVN